MSILRIFSPQLLPILIVSSEGLKRMAWSGYCRPRVLVCALFVSIARSWPSGKSQLNSPESAVVCCIIYTESVHN